MAGNPKLIVLSEKMRGKSFELNKDVMSAGRVEQRDIYIKDTTISTHHCDFIKVGDTYKVLDNDSTNGTRVNNVPVKEQELKNFDVVQLGGVEILFDADDNSSSDNGGGVRTETGIDLESATNTGLATVKHFTNFSPFAAQDQKRTKQSQKVTLIVVGILGVLVLILLVAMLIAMGQMGGK